MNAVVPFRPNAAVSALEDGRQLALIRRMYAADASEDEFNVFVGLCRSLRLDPRRKQVYHLVYNKDKPAKRRVVIVVGIDGFRAVAARTGNYRPDEDEPTYEIDPAAKDPATNPIGLVKATVRVWKHSHGAWHKVTASAFWEEYAPLKDKWVDDPETGRSRKTGEQTLDTSGNWGRMPRVMLAKVAEALALRKAWPEDLSGVHSEEEMDRTTTHVLASDLAEQAMAEERRTMIGGPGITFQWGDRDPLEHVPLGRVTDRVMAFIEQCEKAGELSIVGAWRERNKASLREFWSHNSGEALEIKHKLEAVAARATAVDAEAVPA